MEHPLIAISYGSDDPAQKENDARSSQNAMALAVVADCRAKLADLGERPDHESVDRARRAVALIDAKVSEELEEIATSAAPAGISVAAWRSLQEAKEKQVRFLACDEKLPFDAIIQLDELHQSFESLLKNAEENLLNQPESTDAVLANDRSQLLASEEEVNVEVIKVLQQAQERKIVKVDLRGCGVVQLPEAFGKIPTLETLDLSNNRLKVLPESISGLVNLQNLNLENNLLEELPDSIGLLNNLKFLTVSKNKLVHLPESMLYCSSLVELKVGFNQLEYLPTKIGFHLTNLEHLSVPLNKLRTLPSSLCSLKSIRYLDVNFNQLRSLPIALGNMTSLEVLDASRNFNDLETVPDSIGDLVSLTDLNLSYNQIRVLPDSFGRLQNLKKLQLEENPLIIPPMAVVEAGVEAVLTYMKEKWENRLTEEQQQYSLNENTSQSTWLPWWLGGSWLARSFSGLSERESGINEDYLEQQL